MEIKPIKVKSSSSATDKGRIVFNSLQQNANTRSPSIDISILTLEISSLRCGVIGCSPSLVITHLERSNITSIAPFVNKVGLSSTK